MKNKKLSLLKNLLIPGTLFVVSGCASIISDSKYCVTVNSSVPNAKFAVKEERSGNIIHMGRTPQSIVLESGRGFFQSAKYRIEVEKDGYERGYAYLNADLDPWYIGNIIFGGLIGLLIVDPATGAMWELPEQIYVGLYPSAETMVVSMSTDSPAPQHTSPAVKRTAKGLKREAPQER